MLYTLTPLLAILLCVTHANEGLHIESDAGKVLLGAAGDVGISRSADARLVVEGPGLNVASLQAETLSLPIVPKFRPRIVVSATNGWSGSGSWSKHNNAMSRMSSSLGDTGYFTFVSATASVETDYIEVLQTGIIRVTLNAPGLALSATHVTTGLLMARHAAYLNYLSKVGEDCAIVALAEPRADSTTATCEFHVGAGQAIMLVRSSIYVQVERAFMTVEYLGVAADLVES